jgi:hypothetical protein
VKPNVFFTINLVFPNLVDKDEITSIDCYRTSYEEHPYMMKLPQLSEPFYAFNAFFGQFTPCTPFTDFTYFLQDLRFFTDFYRFFFAKKRKIFLRL